MIDLKIFEFVLIEKKSSCKLGNLNINYIFRNFESVINMEYAGEVLGSSRLNIAQDDW